MSEDQRMYIDTPIGTLEIYPSSDPNHPGVHIDIEGRSVASVEYGAEEGLRTIAWVSGEEDVHDTISWGHSLPEDDISEEDEAIEQAWLEAGDFIEAPDREGCGEPHKFMWDDWDSEEFKNLHERSKLPDDHPDKLYIYSLTEEDGVGTIEEGYRWVNRQGYFFSRTHSPLPRPFKYW